MTPNRPRRIYYSDQNLREKLSRRWQEIRLRTGDILSPIYRDIVGNVYSIERDIDGESFIEVVIKVTENGPRIVANQVWDYWGNDEGRIRNRNTIGSELEREVGRIRSQFVSIMAKPRPEFVKRTDGKPTVLRCSDVLGNVHILTVEMTRYRPTVTSHTTRKWQESDHEVQTEPIH